MWFEGKRAERALEAACPPTTFRLLLQSRTFDLGTALNELPLLSYSPTHPIRPSFASAMTAAPAHILTRLENTPANAQKVAGILVQAFEDGELCGTRDLGTVQR